MKYKLLDRKIKKEESYIFKKLKKLDEIVDKNEIKKLKKELKDIRDKNKTKKIKENPTLGAK